jgi:hypothetical protein
MTRVGKLGTLEVRLAAWVPINERYRRHYVPLTPESESVSSEQGGLVVDTKFRPWVVRDWSRGASFDVWSRGQPGYRIANGVRPHPLKAGLILAFDSETITSTEAANRLGFGQYGMWLIGNNEAQRLTVGDPPAFAAQVSTGAVQLAYSLAEDGLNSAFMFSGHINGTTADDEDPGQIWRWSVSDASQTEHYDLTTDPFTMLPILVSFRQRLFALDDADLYEIDQATADTRTLVADTGMRIPDSAQGAYFQQHRLAVSDVGPIWLAMDGNGDIYVWEYNVAEDTQDIVGRIPGSNFSVYDLRFEKGFYFVAYRPVHHTLAGSVDRRGLVWFKRGGQEGIIGPLPDNGGGNNDELKLAGVIGSELIICDRTSAWGYDLDAGGLVHFATIVDCWDAAVFGGELWVSQASTTIGYVNGTAYLSSGTIHLGWHDWDYPGLVKEFLDCTILTDPLPAGTSVTAAVAVDGSTTYTALTGTHDVDGVTSFTFTVADPTVSPIQGNRFEIRLTFATSNAANTPTVIEVSARTTGAQSVLEVVLQVDAGNVDRQTDEVLVAGLNALKTAGLPITVTDPWQLRDTVAAATYVATVEDVQTPSTEDPVDDEDYPVAVVKLRQRALV